MTFLTWPIAAIAAGIAIPALIILYFLKLKRRDVEVSTTLLWKKAIQDLQANAPFQKLRRNILLVLQLFVLAALLLAIAQPEFRDSGKTNRRHIILIDRSASMSSMDGDQTPSATAPTAGSGAASGAAPAPPSGSSGKVSRLDAAKKQALQIIDGLKEPALFSLNAEGAGAEEAMVIAFDTTAEVRQTFTANKADLRAAVQAITPTDAPTSIERAYTLAQAYTGKSKFEENKGFVPIAGTQATLHIISDGRLPDADKVKTGPQDVVFYHGVGSSTTANVGITSVRAQRAFDEPRKLSIFVGLQSTSKVESAVDAEVSIDGNIMAVQSVKIPAATPPPRNPEDPEQDSKPWVPGLGGFVFNVERAEAGIGSVRIRLPKEASASENVLSADDTGYFAFPPARRLSVAVVSEGSMWLRFALESLNLSKLDMLKPGEFQKMLDEGSTSAYDVYIFDKVLPLVSAPVVKPLLPAPTTAGPGAASSPAAPGATSSSAPTTPPPKPGAAAPAVPAKTRTLPPGRSLVLGAVPAPPLGVSVAGTYEIATIADVQKDHPALGLAGLEKLALGKGARVAIAPDTPVKSIANSDKGPVVLEVQDASTHAIVVTFDPFSTNWPLDSGWVLFLADALSYLGDVNAGATGGLLQTGTVMQTRLPTGAADVRLALPDRESANLEPGVDGSVAFGPLYQVGLYTLSWTGPATAIDIESGGRVRRALAANLIDTAESDTTAAPTLALASKVVAAEGDQDTRLTRKLWPWLVLAGLAIVMLEWFVYNRKVSI